MKIIKEPVFFKDLLNTKEIDLGDILKIVVDINKQIIGIDAEMHADIEERMLGQGSDQSDLWGANLVSFEEGFEIEYTSFINIRPGLGNRAMEIQDEGIRKQVQMVILKLVK